MGNRYYFVTFEEWCIKNNRQDLLELWDYDKNDKLPSEVPAGTKAKYWFKCPNGIHGSSLKRILSITDKPDHKLICIQCAYHNEGDMLGEVFGELTVVGYDEQRSKEKNYPYLFCECSCGNIVSVSKYKLKYGLKSICGKAGRHKRKPITAEEFDPFNQQYMQELRQSPEYHQYRREVMEKDNFSCIVCGSHKDIEVHHIYPFASYPNERLNPLTGACICKIHHSLSESDSFHNIYGVYNNTPEQLEEYVNITRNKLGINNHFDVYDYMNNIESDNLSIDDSMIM